MIIPAILVANHCVTYVFLQNRPNFTTTKTFEKWLQSQLRSKFFNHILENLTCKFITYILFLKNFSVSNPASAVKITLTPELDETLKRIQDSKNVAGIILVNKEGITVKSSLDSSVTAQVSDWLSRVMRPKVTKDIRFVVINIYHSSALKNNNDPLNVCFIKTDTHWNHIVQG